MDRAETGNRVKVRYTKRLKDGRVIESSEENAPLEIRIGSNLVPLFEKAVRGARTGETKTVELMPEDTHGPWRRDLLMKMKKVKLPEGFTPAVGKPLKIVKRDGTRETAYVRDVRGETVTLDMNHPLAGKTIFVDIELLEIK